MDQLDIQQNTVKNVFQLPLSGNFAKILQLTVIVH